MLANNTAPNGPDGDTGGNLIAEYTFVKNATNFIGLFSNVQLNVDAKLGALVEVTTPVRTKFRPLLAGSPAIDFVSGMPAPLPSTGRTRSGSGSERVPTAASTRSQ